MTLAITGIRYKHVSVAALLTALLLAACGSEDDEQTGVTAADVATCDASPSDAGDCAEGKRAFDCPDSVNLKEKCDYAGEWESGGSNEPTRSGSTWCCAL